jgi:hypothetical protein
MSEEDGRKGKERNRRRIARSRRVHNDGEEKKMKDGARPSKIFRAKGGQENHRVEEHPSSHCNACSHRHDSAHTDTMGHYTMPTLAATAGSEHKGCTEGMGIKSSAAGQPRHYCFAHLFTPCFFFLSPLCAYHTIPLLPLLVPNAPSPFTFMLAISSYLPFFYCNQNTFLRHSLISKPKRVSTCPIKKSLNASDLTPYSSWICPP